MGRPTRSASKSLQPTPQSSKSTPKRSPRSRNTAKSKYFEPPTDDEDSSYDEGVDEVSSDSSVEDIESEEEPPKKKPKTTPNKKVTPKKSPPNKSPGRGRSKKEDSDEEPWETFVPKEASPEVGDIDYEPSKIHPNTLQFLKGNHSFKRKLITDLVLNNDRDWFWSHEVCLLESNAD